MLLSLLIYSEIGSQVKHNQTNVTYNIKNNDLFYLLFPLQCFSPKFENRFTIGSYQKLLDL